MDFLFINLQELSALMGLPYIHRVAYVFGIRPYMDRETSIVGLKRRISYQSLAETLYVEPHQGIVDSGSPSRDQIRRVIKCLERVGLIQIQSTDKNLILKCLLAGKDYSGQNKPTTNQPPYHATNPHDEKSVTARDLEVQPQKAAIGKTEKPATPLNNNNYLFIFLLQQFEQFWELYPEKKSKQKAWEAFQAVNPDEALCAEILAALQAQIEITQRRKAQGLWVASWKYPANWLLQACWKDELELETKEELVNETHSPNFARRNAYDPLWESCKGGLESDIEPENNVIAFASYRKNSQTS